MIRLGVTEALSAEPLLHGIKTRSVGQEFEIRTASSAENCQNLIDKTLDIALISPLDYARHNTSLKIIRDVAAYTFDSSYVALLFFRENMIEINPVAVERLDTQYQLLARLLLNEYYEMENEWKLMDGPLDPKKALRKYPAVFLENERALYYAGAGDNYLDIVSEWSDKTELPYIHYFFAVDRDLEDTTIVDPLLKSRTLGLQRLPEIARNYAADKPNNADFYREILSRHTRYSPGEDTWLALQNYFEYLFYYAVVEYLPEIRFL